MNKTQLLVPLFKPSVNSDISLWERQILNHPQNQNPLSYWDKIQHR